MSSAMLCVRPEVKERACGFGEYPSSVATVSPRLRISSLTRPGLPSALDTVDVATPAALATSEIVTATLAGSPCRLIPFPKAVEQPPCVLKLRTGRPPPPNVWRRDRIGN